MTSMVNDEPPLVISAGFTVDPSAVIHAAKQLATSTKRWVILETESGRYPNLFTLEYMIKPDASGAYSSVDTVIIRAKEASNPPTQKQTTIEELL